MSVKKKNTTNVKQANRIKAVVKKDTKHDAILEAHGSELAHLHALVDSLGRRTIQLENNQPEKESLIKCIVITTIGATLGVLLAMGILEYFK
jgi:hypothetical protein